MGLAASAIRCRFSSCSHSNARPYPQTRRGDRFARLAHWHGSIQRRAATAGAKGMRMRWLLAVALVVAMAGLSSCDVFDSIQRPPAEIHMYGDAIDINSFVQIPKAQIVVQIDNKSQRFT